MIVTVISVGVCGVCVLLFLIFYIKSKGRYDEYIEYVDKEEYGLKDFIPIGLAMSDMEIAQHILLYRILSCPG